MKVLIVKVSALGDVVHALPVLAWLKSADESMQIDWLVEESFAPFLEEHPLIRKVHQLSTKAWRRGGVRASVKGAWQMIRCLRQEKYDVVLDLQGNAKSGLFTLMSGAPLRCGFDRDAARENLNLLATNRKVAPGELDFHITDRSLSIARAAFPKGSELRVAGPLPVDATALQTIQQQLGKAGLVDKPIIVLHYGTTWVTKLWPIASWQTLALRLVEEKGLRPVLTWGNEKEYAAVQAIQDACTGRCFIWPRGSLKELSALLSEADLVVGGDTGPVHIAAAVGTATVSIFRVTDPDRNAPRGKIHAHAVANFDCAPCLRKECDRDLECGKSISVDTVFELVVSHFNKTISPLS